MRKRVLFLLAAAAALLSACSGSETLEDVSVREEYKQILGARYEVVGPLEAYGIGRNPHRKIDYVSLQAVFGYTGWEVGFNVPVQRGSTVTVTHVFRSNRWFDRGITLGVRLEGSKLPVEAPVRIDLRNNNEGEARVSLNPEIYRKL